MAGSALICRRGRPFLPLGALLFVGSDALLSLGLFERGASAGSRLVWPLYALAQMAIAFGWIGGGSTPGSPRSTPGRGSALGA